MTTYFVSRHPGAIGWLARQGIEIDKHVTHLDVSVIERGDSVLGTLPVNLIADIVEKGARYWHLSIDLPADLRGKELNAEMIEKYGGRLEEFVANRVNSRQ